MSELLPCPFCGGEAATVTNQYFWSVRCRQCGAENGDYVKATEAIEAWNTRAERTCKVDYRSGIYIGGGWYCSECGGYMHDDMQQDMAYCPNCGAKVVGE